MNETTPDIPNASASAAVAVDTSGLGAMPQVPSTEPKATRIVGRNVRSMEAVYSLAFWFFLWAYFAGTLASSWQPNWVRFGVIAFTALFVTYQLLRMYYYLHTFEEERAMSEEAHFLDCLGRKTTSAEKIVRFVLAIIIVATTKVADLFPALDDFYSPAAFLVVCFVLLFVWDSVIWTAKQSVQLNQTSSTIRFRQFFYLKSEDDKTGRRWKMAERLIGWIAACLAFGLLSAPISKYFADQVFSFLFAFLAVSVVVYLLLPFLAYLRMEQGWEAAKKEHLFPLRRYPVEPLYTIFDYFIPGGRVMKAKSYQGAAYAILVLVLVALTTTKCTRPPEQIPKIAVHIATSKNLWCTLTLVAAERGFFLEEGLEPQMNYQAAGRLNMDALVGGSAEFANVVETNLAYQSLNGYSNLAVRGKIVSAIDYAILTKADAGITNPADLRGKRLAYAQATGAESFLFWFLEKEKIPANSVRLTPLQPAGLVDNFIANPTEAVATWEPFVTTIRTRLPRLGPTFQTDNTGFAGTMNVAMRRDWAAAHKETVEAYERAMEKASRFVIENPAEAQKIMSAQAGLPVETVQAIWSRFDFRYNRSSPHDATLIVDVVRRIRTNVPDMAAKQPVDAEAYFAPLK